MNKLLLFAFLLCIGSNAFAQKVTDPKERKAFKDEFVKECMKSATDDSNSAEVNKAMQVYCDCSAEKVLDKLSKKQIESMAAWTEKEVEEMLTPIIQTCLDKLQEDLKEIMK
jgi:predicted lipoprotein